MSETFDASFVPWFRAVAPYIHKHRGQIMVVGLTGEAIAAGHLSPIVQDLALLQSLGLQIVLVHGFRPQVSEQLRVKGHQAQYSHGWRITDSITLDCAQEAAGQLRFEIEAAFSQGLPNTPMAGATVRVVSGNFVTARPIGLVDGVDFLHSGLVRKVDTEGIKNSLKMGALVLISPFGFSPTGEAFNLAMEDVATATAIALQAHKLLFLTEVEGLCQSSTPQTAQEPNVQEPNVQEQNSKTILTEITLPQAKALLQNRSATPTSPPPPLCYHLRNQHRCLSLFGSLCEGM